MAPRRVVLVALVAFVAGAALAGLPGVHRARGLERDLEDARRERDEAVKANLEQAAIAFRAIATLRDERYAHLRRVEALERELAGLRDARR